MIINPDDFNKQESLNEELYPFQQELNNLKEWIINPKKIWEMELGIGTPGGENETKKIKKITWDKNPDFFRENPEKKYWKHGDMQFYTDCETTFYKVKSGDSLGAIRKKISKIKGFEYLKDLNDYGLLSFNMIPETLLAGKWIPLPTEKKERIINDEQLFYYINEGFQEMKTHPEYGKQVKETLEKVTEKQFIASLMAIAKQEAGSKPVGNFVLHKWESAKHNRCFSYSIFHILNKGNGLTARKNLNMTLGQTYHPKNATKLAIAYLCEKVNNLTYPQKLTKYIPIQGNKENPKSHESMGWLYNGNWEAAHKRNIKRWKKEKAKAKRTGTAFNTPKPIPYPEKIAKYYDDAMEFLNQEKNRKTNESITKKEKTKPRERYSAKEIEKIEARNQNSAYINYKEEYNLTNTLQAANNKAARKEGIKTLLKGNPENRNMFRSKIEKKGGLNEGDEIRFGLNFGLNEEIKSVFAEIIKNDKKKWITIAYKDLIPGKNWKEENRKREEIDIVKKEQREKPKNRVSSSMEYRNQGETLIRVLNNLKNKSFRIDNPFNHIDRIERGLSHVFNDKKVYTGDQNKLVFENNIPYFVLTRKGQTCKVHLNEAYITFLDTETKTTNPAFAKKEKKDQKLPKTKEYTVKSGDTLASIAREIYNIPQSEYPKYKIEKIMEVNNLSEGTPLPPNKKLKIPVRE